jgi:shikimate kinase
MPAVVHREAQLRALQARVIKAERRALRADRDRTEAEQELTEARADLIRQVAEALAAFDDESRAELLEHLAGNGTPHSNAA